MWMDNCRNIRSGLATQTTRLRVDIGACEYVVAYERAEILPGSAVSALGIPTEFGRPEVTAGGASE